MISYLAKGLRAFGRFWWQFLVGDTPEMALATVGILVVAFAVRHRPWLGAVVLPALVIVVLMISVFRGRIRRR